MVVRRQKKVKKQRGSRTHGWGLVHRGSGQKGGVGNAGRGKKAHCKKPQVWKERYLGKHGFVRHGEKIRVHAISIKQVEQCLNSWSTSECVKQEHGSFTVDLSKL